MNAVSLVTLALLAVSPAEMLARYGAQTPGGASPTRGKALYVSSHVDKQGRSVSCATCHTADPRAVGQTRAGKPVEPLAPAANPQRFTDEAKVEKWFGRNCGDVLGRACTAQEKADFIAYLLSIN